MKHLIEHIQDIVSAKLVDRCQKSLEWHEGQLRYTLHGYVYDVLAFSLLGVVVLLFGLLPCLLIK